MKMTKGGSPVPKSMKTHSKSTGKNNKFSELPELEPGALAQGAYVNPHGLTRLPCWIESDVFFWLSGLPGDRDFNINKILKAEMERFEKSSKPRRK